jgi:hypothetical protein
MRYSVPVRSISARILSVARPMMTPSSPRMLDGGECSVVMVSGAAAPCTQVASRNNVR